MSSCPSLSKRSVWALWSDLEGTLESSSRLLSVLGLVQVDTVTCNHILLEEALTIVKSLQEKLARMSAEVYHSTMELAEGI